MNYNDTMNLAAKLADTIESDLKLLQNLIEQRKDLPGCIVELGAYKCGSTIAMAQVTDKTVYSFDLFGGLPYGPQGAFDKFGATDFDAIVRYTCRYPNIKLVRGMHEDTVPVFPPQPITLAFFDSDFYDSHVTGLENIWPMVVEGGIVVFHDWLFDDVQRAITDTVHPSTYGFRGQLKDSNMGAIFKV